MSAQTQQYPVFSRHYIMMIVTFLATLPGLYVGWTHNYSSPELSVLLLGIAVFGAAFILSWAAEVAEIDISQSLAVAILALLAVLPEYAVDFVFTWKAAHDPSQAHFAIANMTGSNRLLVGFGWPIVLGIFVFMKKRKEIILEKSQHVEIFYLALATLYSFTIPLKDNLNLIDCVILVTLFGLYARRAAQMETTEPELVGPPRIVANMNKIPRRSVTVLLFAWAGFVIFIIAEPFAHNLVEMGRSLGIDEFLLVQWLAPIASESPEFIIAATWAARGSAAAAMKVLISSKVNQWTLLIGTIPLVYAISGGSIRPFPLDELQHHELLLTAAQSLFGVAVLVNLKFNRHEGVLLLVLFLAQLIVAQIRLEVMYIYLGLAVVYIILNRCHLIPAMRMGFGLKQK